MIRTTPPALLALTAAFVFAHMAAAQPPTVSKLIPLVRITQTTDVSARPEAVWAVLTTGRNMVTWCPLWKKPANAKVNLKRVGDVLDFTDAFGNDGRSVVTFLTPAKELRMVHEPTNGSYYCQARIQLEPNAAGGTTVTYRESYTDESDSNEMQATLKKVLSEMVVTLAALKRTVEKD
jgi:uncharacterized protein YndB with AHSA1/START domain